MDVREELNSRLSPGKKARGASAPIACSQYVDPVLLRNRRETTVTLPRWSEIGAETYLCDEITRSETVDCLLYILRRSQKGADINVTL
jgi:hypothetical protein